MKGFITLYTVVKLLIFNVESFRELSAVFVSEKERNISNSKQKINSLITTQVIPILTTFTFRNTGAFRILIIPMNTFTTRLIASRKERKARVLVLNVLTGPLASIQVAEVILLIFWAI